MAAFRGGHRNHGRSLERLAQAKRDRSACAAHTLAEVYAAMTALPVKPILAPEQALLFIDDIRERCSIVALDERDYVETLARAAETGLTSGRVYDALILRCAHKIGAKTIYTWNLKHFRAIAPHLADRIQTP